MVGRSNEREPEAPDGPTGGVERPEGWHALDIEHVGGRVLQRAEADHHREPPAEVQGVLEQIPGWRRCELTAKTFASGWQPGIPSWSSSKRASRRGAGRGGDSRGCDGPHGSPVAGKRRSEWSPSMRSDQSSRERH